MITVYSKPSCVQCDQTKRYLDRQHIPYVTVDVTQDEDAYTRLVAAGFSSVPVVDPGDGHDAWAGFRLDHLRALAATHKATP